MDDVARRAGVGVGTVYRHFPTKEALVAELVRQKFRVWAPPAPASPRVRRRAVRRIRRPAAHQRGVLRARRRDAAGAVRCRRTHLGPGPGTEVDELYALTAELIARAQQAGTMRLTCALPTSGC